MTNAEMEFVLSLKESDAERIVRAAKSEAGRDGNFIWFTNSWAAYKQARALMVLYVRENAKTAPLGLSSKELGVITKEAEPLLSPENLKFAFYEKKAKHQLGL